MYKNNLSVYSCPILIFKESRRIGRNQIAVCVILNYVYYVTRLRRCSGCHLHLLMYYGEELMLGKLCNCNNE